MLKLIQKIIGTKNDKELKRYKKRVEAINALEAKYSSMSDSELRAAFDALKARVAAGETLDAVLEDSFAITREASRRVLGMRHFDVQLIGGLVLSEGRIAEMKTGEGKTLVATLPVALYAMMGKGVHVVTVNDYLATRDATEMGHLYNFLGYSVGTITSSIDEASRKAAYACDITYGTNNEYGFDYLRDNMKYSREAQVQRGHFFAIVDEVDSILIDEARTPLIISGPTNRRLDNYIRSDEVAKALERDVHFAVDEKNRTVLLTEEGIERAQELFGVDNLYELEHAILAHHLDQALKANYLFKRDVDYVVRKGEVLIVDEFTGRIAEGRRYSEGLHQALEAKEGVAIKEESQTLAEITYQNYFRQYEKLAGMTGTAQTEAAEFAQIYGLEVISIPTNLPVARKDLNDLIYKTEREKMNAVLAKVKELYAKGQPVLIGTASIEKSEMIHELLTSAAIPHTVLNAKNHEKEAEIIKNAGLRGSVTVATNMAGRGVDIKLTEETRALGGLYIIGTERHESRRIDNQLRGRSGRQGDPGVSQFYLSLEDNLLRIFGGDKIRRIMDRLGIEEGDVIESAMVTRAVENAQKRVEAMHFESRKHLLEYDDVGNAQRKVIFGFRNELLSDDVDISQKIADNRALYVDHLLEKCDIMAGLSSEEFNLVKLGELLTEEIGLIFDTAALKNREYEDVKAAVIEAVENYYVAKMAPLDKERVREIEKIIYLQVLDEAWREHLYQMDILKTGIGLRGYNQKDPLVEYKKESFNLFTELITTIKIRSAKVLLSLQLRFNDDPEQTAHHLQDEAFEGTSAIHPEASNKKREERRRKYQQKKQG
ncbi:MAG: preprotein translocase subunit SecA [Campylobacterales bacterium]